MPSLNVYSDLPIMYIETRDIHFGVSLSLLTYIVYSRNEGSGETMRKHRLVRAFAAGYRDVF